MNLAQEASSIFLGKFFRFLIIPLWCSGLWLLSDHSCPRRSGIFCAVKPSIWFTNLSYTLASLILAFFQFFERLLDDYLCRILMRLSAFSWKRWFSTALFLIIREEAFDPTHRLLFFLSGLGNGLECFLNLEYGKPFAWALPLDDKSLDFSSGFLLGFLWSLRGWVSHLLIWILIYSWAFWTILWSGVCQPLFLLFFFSLARAWMFDQSW